MNTLWKNATQETILAIKEEVPEDDFQVEYKIFPARNVSKFHHNLCKSFQS